MTCAWSMVHHRSWVAGLGVVAALVSCDEPDARTLDLSPLLPSTSPTEASCQVPNDCPTDRAHCSSGLCVECLEDPHCGDKKPACHAGACVACTANTHCPTGRACNETLRTCALACSSDADCVEKKEAFCNGSYCVECTDESQCDARRPHCSTEGGACLECGSDADCATSMRPACGPDNRCVECQADEHCTQPGWPVCIQARATCGQCTSDAQCGDAGSCDLERAECGMPPR